MSIEYPQGNVENRLFDRDTIHDRKTLKIRKKEKKEI
jgi:hypothetical protein